MVNFIREAKEPDKPQLLSCLPIINQVGIIKAKSEK